MAIKGNSLFPKAPGLEPRHRMVLCHYTGHSLQGGGLTPQLRLGCLWHFYVLLFIEIQFLSVDVSLSTLCPGLPVYNLPVCCLKYLYSYLPSFCCFSVCWHCCYWLLWLVFLCFFLVLKSSYRCIYAIFNAGVSFSSFLNTYSLSMSSLESKTLCIDIYFLVLLSFCLTSFLDHFRNDIECLTRTILRSLYLWWDFYCRGTLFLLFSIPVWWCSLPITQSTCNLFFSAIWWFPDFVVLFLLLLLFFSLFYHHSTLLNTEFHSYILIVYSHFFCIRVYSFESFSALADGFSLEFEWQQISSL